MCSTTSLTHKVTPLVLVLLWVVSVWHWASRRIPLHLRLKQLHPLQSFLRHSLFVVCFRNLRGAVPQHVTACVAVAGQGSQGRTEAPPARVVALPRHPGPL